MPPLRSARVSSCSLLVLALAGCSAGPDAADLVGEYSIRGEVGACEVETTDGEPADPRAIVPSGTLEIAIPENASDSCALIATLHLTPCEDCNRMDCALCIHSLEGGAGGLVTGRLEAAPEVMSSPACSLGDLSLIVPWSFRAEELSGTFMFGEVSRQATFIAAADGTLSVGDSPPREAQLDCTVVATER